MSFSFTFSIKAVLLGGLGEFGKLTSWTVSNGPLPGVRIPEGNCASSISLSDAACCSMGCGEGMGCGCGEGVGRCKLIEGSSWSLRRAGTGGLVLSWGGGDRKRGDTGHRGLSLRSTLKFGFWGVGAWICCS